MSSLFTDIEVHALNGSRSEITGRLGITTNLRCSMTVVGRSMGAGDYQYLAQFVEPDLLIKPDDHQITLVLIMGLEESVDLRPGQTVEFFEALKKLATGIVRNIREAPPAP